MADSTTARSCADDSTTWRSESAQRRPRRTRRLRDDGPEAPQTPEQRAERAIRLVFSVILPRIASSPDWRPQLGYARPSSARACVRSHEFFYEIAAELGEWWRRVAMRSAQADGSSWRAMSRADAEEAGVALADVVRAMPRPVRDVVVRRASGMSWAKISAALPSRAYFSLTDDWASAMVLLSSRHSDLIDRVL